MTLDGDEVSAWLRVCAAEAEALLLFRVCHVLVSCRFLSQPLSPSSIPIAVKPIHIASRIDFPSDQVVGSVTGQPVLPSS